MPVSTTAPETKLIAPETSPPGLERWHIDEVRRNKKGAVTKVHHVIWGWMRPSSLYFLEKLHDLFPGVNATGNSLAHGGYIFKSAVVSTAPSVFGLSLPVGIGLYAWASINMYNNIQDAKKNQGAGDAFDAAAEKYWADFKAAKIKDPSLFENAARDYYSGLKLKARLARESAGANAIEAAKWGAAMALPFGDLWLFYKGIEDAAGKGGALADIINNILKPGQKANPGFADRFGFRPPSKDQKWDYQALSDQAYALLGGALPTDTPVQRQAKIDQAKRDEAQQIARAQQGFVGGL